MGRNMEDTTVRGLHFLRGLVAFEHEKGLARLDLLAFFFQPRLEDALFHGPAESRQRNFNGHSAGSFAYSACRFLIAAAICSVPGTTAASSGGL